MIGELRNYPTKCTLTPSHLFYTLIAPSSMYILDQNTLLTEQPTGTDR